MNLKVNNFAVIGEADVGINGLTVIAGPNGSGKSTIGKLFYSVINAVNKTKTEFEREKIRRVRNVLSHNEDLSLDNFFAVKKRAETREDAARICAAGHTDDYKERLSKECLYKINKVLSVTEPDFFRACALKMFKYEFGYQLLNVNNMETATIEYTHPAADTSVRFEIKSNTQIEITAKFPEKTAGKSEYTEAFYIDTPYIMDDTGFGLYHRRELRRRLAADNDNLAQKVFGQLFMDIGGGETVNIMNVSAGFKTVLMLKSMYAKGMLGSGNLLILDEPEIHLHPDLQITLAEILITLVKSGGLKVLINTHSPYFLEALEVYAEKSGVCDICRYYLTEEGDFSSRIIETTGEVEQIYKLLAEPFRKLEKIRNEDI